MTERNRFRPEQLLFTSPPALKEPVSQIKSAAVEGRVAILSLTCLPLGGFMVLVQSSDWDPDGGRKAPWSPGTCWPAAARLLVSLTVGLKPLSSAASLLPSCGSCRPPPPLCPADRRGPAPPPGLGPSPPPLWTGPPPLRPASTAPPSAGSDAASASAVGRSERSGTELLQELGQKH